MAVCGSPVSYEDQVLWILAGLRPEYEPTITVLTSTDDQQYNVKASCALLLASESRALQQTLIIESPASANVAIHSRPWNNIFGSQLFNGGGRGSGGQISHGGRDRGREAILSNKLTCQLSGKLGMQFSSATAVTSPSLKLVLRRTQGRQQTAIVPMARHELEASLL